MWRRLRRRFAAGVARRVVAVDYDEAAVAHVRSRYPRVEAMQANLAELPLPDASVDVVVNFQVIEHLWDQAQFVAECARVLRPLGLLMVSTPNRVTFSPGRDTPINPFHTRELNAAELTQLLVDAGFARVSISGLFHGPRLVETDARHGGSIIDAQIARAVADGPWTPELRADVAAVATDDFDLVEAGDREIDGSLDLVAIAVRPRADPPAPCPGCSPWCCTPTCPGWPTTAAGRSARNGSTSRGRRPTCR